MQYGNYCVRGVGEMMIHHEVKLSAVSASRSTPRARSECRSRDNAPTHSLPEIKDIRLQFPYTSKNCIRIFTFVNVLGPLEDQLLHGILAVIK